MGDPEPGGVTTLLDTFRVSTALLMHDRGAVAFGDELPYEVGWEVERVSNLIGAVPRHLRTHIRHISVECHHRHLQRHPPLQA